MICKLVLTLKRCSCLSYQEILLTSAQLVLLLPSHMPLLHAHGRQGVYRNSYCTCSFLCHRLYLIICPSVIPRVFSNFYSLLFCCILFHRLNLTQILLLTHNLFKKRKNVTVGRLLPDIYPKITWTCKVCCLLSKKLCMKENSSSLTQ